MEFHGDDFNDLKKIINVFLRYYETTNYSTQIIFKKIKASFIHSTGYSNLPGSPNSSKLLPKNVFFFAHVRSKVTPLALHDSC